MKKIFYFLVCFSLILISCEKDDSLDPRPDLVPGQFVKLDIIKPLIDANNLSTSSFVGTLSTPSNNVDKYELYVSRRNAFGFVSDFVLYETITTFPHELKVNASKLTTSGIPTILDSDILRFYGKSYKDGNVCDYNSLSATVKSQKSLKQGYKFFVPVTSNITDIPENQYSW